MFLRILTAMALLMFMGTAQAGEAEQAQLKEASAAFAEMFGRGQYDGAIPHAERALRLSEQIYGPNAGETVTILNNLAYCYLLARYRERSITIAGRALERIEASGGKNDPRAVRSLLLMSRAHGEADPEKGKEALMRALKIQEAAYGKDDPRLSEVLRELGNNALLSRSPMNGRRFYERAVEVTERAPPEYADVRAMALFELARYEMALRNNRTAEKRFLEVLAARAAAPPNDPLQLSTRSFLIELYDRLDQPDRSTEHVQYLARVEPEADNVEMKPLFKLVPEYPEDALMAGKEGDVRLKATIDSTGRVTDPRVVSSTPRGTFDKACLESVKRWRYKPAVVDGRYVARENQDLRCVFNIRRR